MDENSKEYQSVIGSIILHLVLVLSLYFIPAFDDREDSQKDSTVEVEFIEKSEPRHYVRSLTPPSELKPKKTNLLSSQATSVKQETVSPRIGEDRNVYQPPKIKNFGIKKEDLQGSILNVPKKLPTLEYTQDLQSQFSFQLDKVKYGAVTLLNSDYSVFSSFYDRIHPGIRYDWLKGVTTYLKDPMIPELLRLNKDLWVSRVEVLLDKKGNFLKTILVNSSGSEPLDLAATEAFKKSAPYINPPEGLIAKDGKIHLYFEFNVIVNPYYFARTNKQ